MVDTLIDTKFKVFRLCNLDNTSNFVFELIKVINWREIAHLSLIRTTKYAKFRSRTFKNNFTKLFTIAVTLWVVQNDAKPVPSAQSLNFSHKFNFTPSCAYHDLASGTNSNFLRFFLLKIFVDGVTIWFHKVGVCFLHLVFEFSKTVISLVVVLFADCVFLHSTHVVPFAKSIGTSVMDVNCELIPAAILVKGLVRVLHHAHTLHVGVAKL